MTTVRPGFVATDGIGPKISHSIDAWRNDPSAAGFDSLGNKLVRDENVQERDTQVYEAMMNANAKMVGMDMEAGMPAVNVAKTVKDALVSVTFALEGMSAVNLILSNRQRHGCSQCTPSEQMHSWGRWQGTSYPSLSMSGWSSNSLANQGALEYRICSCVYSFVRSLTRPIFQSFAE
jgi:hypothetical protein